MKERSTFGKFSKYALIGFNVLTILWGVLFTLSIFKDFIDGETYINGEIDPTLGIGVFFVIAFTIIIWLIGNFILGLMTILTRPKGEKK